MNLPCQMYIIIVNICCLLLLISSCTGSVVQANDNPVNQTNVGNVSTAVNNSNGNITQQATRPTKVSVSTEGGSFVSDQLDKTHSSREGKVDPPPSGHNANLIKTNSSTQITSSTVASVAAVTKPPTGLEAQATNSTIKDNTTSDLSETNEKPVYEVPAKVDGTNSVPKKEPKSDSEETLPTLPPTITVTPISNNYTDTSTQGNIQMKDNQTNTTLKPGTNITVATPLGMETTPKVVKEKVKKPLFTEATDDSFASSNFVSGRKNEPSKNNVPSLENIEKRKSKSADYVVPIVGIILSVPLVTIIVSVLYKRTAEWWHHRHYRRMDFLIEGMYNN